MSKIESSITYIRAVLLSQTHILIYFQIELGKIVLIIMLQQVFFLMILWHKRADLKL